MKIKPWIEAFRLRTLPVSIAGVLAGCAVAVAYGRFLWQPAVICLVFALMAQIVSNLANEYYDFKNGIDKKGRQGFRRGLTEGDISPASMKRMIIILTLIDCLLGCTLVMWGGYWLIAVGVLIVAAAFAYSTGPWPLSHHGMGDELVIIFYGIVPVTLTAYVQCGDWIGGDMASGLGEMWKIALMVGAGVGLLGDNVLIVNNIRDCKDDSNVGKRTKAVIFGAGVMKIAYIAFWVISIPLIWYSLRAAMPVWSWAGFAAVAIWYVPLSMAVCRLEGRSLNKVLRYTSLQLLMLILWTLLCVIIHYHSLISYLSPYCMIFV